MQFDWAEVNNHRQLNWNDVIAFKLAAERIIGRRVIELGKHDVQSFWVKLSYPI